MLSIFTIAIQAHRTAPSYCRCELFVRLSVCTSVRLYVRGAPQTALLKK